MRRFILCAAVMAMLAGTLPADTRDLELTVTGGPSERRHVPACVAVTLPVAVDKAGMVILKTADGQTIPAQLTEPGLLAKVPKAEAGKVVKELHFILPRLSADQTVTLKASFAKAPRAEEEGFRWHDTPGDNTELRLGARPVLRYMYKALDDSTKAKRELTYKPYHHVFDPEGGRLVTKGPGGQDTHHRGLFYGFCDISYGNGKTANVWECKGDCYQSHEKFLATEAGPVLGRHRIEIAWHGPGKEVFAREERELTAYDVPGGTLIEFASRLRSTVGKVKLDGNPQHAGFHFRADNEVASKTSRQTYFVRPDGAGKPGETRNWPDDKEQVNLPWDAMSFVLGHQRFTAAYLDRPSNPKEARYSERAYGRFGSYFVDELTDENSVDVNYRVWLQRGEMTVPEVAALSANFVDPVVVNVK